MNQPKQKDPRAKLAHLGQSTNAMLQFADEMQRIDANANDRRRSVENHNPVKPRYRHPSKLPQSPRKTNISPEREIPREITVCNYTEIAVPPLNVHRSGGIDDSASAIPMAPPQRQRQHVRLESPEEPLLEESITGLPTDEPEKESASVNDEASEWQRLPLEIFPNQFVDFISAEETKYALLGGMSKDTICESCHSFLYCHSDCTLVLCSFCESVGCLPCAEVKDPYLGIGLTVKNFLQELRKH